MPFAWVCLRVQPRSEVSSLAVCGHAHFVPTLCPGNWHNILAHDPRISLLQRNPRNVYGVVPRVQTLHAGPMHEHKQHG